MYRLDASMTYDPWLVAVMMTYLPPVLQTVAEMVAVMSSLHHQTDQVADMSSLHHQN